jgi:RNA polymerase sigma factor (sigma-70 family)
MNKALEEIIEGCKQNKLKYQKKLYELYKDKMFAICMRYAKSFEEAEDVFQDAFVKVFKYIHQFDYKGSFDGWISRIFVNTAITNYKLNKKRYYKEEIDVTDYERESFEIDEPEFTMDELMKVINELPLGYKTIFNLYAIEGYKHKEIAEMLEIDINTSKSQYSRAKKILREKLMKLSKSKVENDK